MNFGFLTRGFSFLMSRWHGQQVIAHIFSQQWCSAFFFFFAMVRSPFGVSYLSIPNRLFVADQRTHALDVEMNKILALLLADHGDVAVPNRLDLLGVSLLFDYR